MISDNAYLAEKTAQYYATMDEEMREEKLCFDCIRCDVATNNLSGELPVDFENKIGYCPVERAFISPVDTNQYWECLEWA